MSVASSLSRIIVPHGTAAAEQLQIGLDLMAMLLWHHGEVEQHVGFETYTCSLGIVEGGIN